MPGAAPAATRPTLTGRSPAMKLISSDGPSGLPTHARAKGATAESPRQRPRAAQGGPDSSGAPPAAASAATPSTSFRRHRRRAIRRPQVRPIHVRPQILTAHRAVRGALDGWAALGGHLFYSAPPLADHDLAHTQGTRQRRARAWDFKIRRQIHGRMVANGYPSSQAFGSFISQTACYPMAR